MTLSRRGLILLGSMCLATGLPGCGGRDRPPSGDPPRRAALAESVRTGDRRILFLGDSITECWNREGRDTWGERIAPIGALNLGIGGDTTDSLLARLPDYSAADPAAVVLLIGTNDTKDPDLDAEQLAARVVGVADRIAATWPGARILVVGILPREPMPGPRRRLVAETNRIVAARADTHEFDYLDLDHLFVGQDGTISPELMPDGLHLSAEGYRRMAGPLREWIDQTSPGPHR